MTTANPRNKDTELNFSFDHRLSAVLAKLVWDLQSFLSVLDAENLSYIAQAQKKSISELLSKLQPQDTPGNTDNNWRSICLSFE